MSQFRSDLALIGLAVVGILADLACVLTGHQVPQLFEQVALAGLTGAAGVALPLRASTTPDPTPVPAPVTYQPYTVPAAQVQQSPAATAPQVYTGPVGQ